MYCRKKYSKIRLYYCSGLLHEGRVVTLEKEASHYVRDVMRGKVGDVVILFDGAQGDWMCSITDVRSGSVVLVVEVLSRVYVPSDPLTLYIALVKPNVLRNIVRQATEMGVTLIQPMTTEYSVVDCINIKKCKIWAIEAAEQCGRQDIPEIAPVIEFKDLGFSKRQLVLCDETGHGQIPEMALCGKRNVGVIVGPEGGFSKSELEYAESFCAKMSFGSRILRVDTAVVTALAYVNEYYALNKVAN